MSSGSPTEASIRASPYEKGLYFVSPEPGTTLQSIGSTEWKVGERYTLEKVLGYGSFSCVCLALDTVTGERVALKRIGDVLHSAEQAKRTLREIAILRRTSHPNLIGLRDCFVRPSSTGQCRMINGRLVNCSIDLYIAMEYADGGDLFHMRGQLAPEEVASLMWQLLQAVQYLHSMHVWHRDVKSQNAFIHWEKGVRVVKLGDFGSARSALMYDLESEKLGQGRGRFRRRAHTPQRPAERSFLEMDKAMQPSDLYAQPGDMSASDIDTESESHSEADLGAAAQRSGSTSTGGFSVRFTAQKRKSATSNTVSGKGAGFKAPLTRVVATPCYRAPEVVMSRGGYTSALDMWGIGCIFGELLQRVAYVGSAATPHLAVAPLFALRCMPKTPETGETFGRPECAGTRRELQALFDVVGTPSWRDAQAVEMPEWRRYLERLPGKAPSLYRRFKSAGEVAVHLLSRLLDFDPVGRASCDEALAHEFFAGLREELRIGIGTSGRVGSGAMVGDGGDDGTLEDEEMAEGGVEEDDEHLPDIGRSGAVAAPLTTADITVDMRHLSFNGPDMSELLQVDAAAVVATQEAMAAPGSELASGGDGVVAAGVAPSEEIKPGRALALLEEELEQICDGAPEGLLNPGSEGCQRLRQLLEAECSAAAAEAAARRSFRRAQQDASGAPQGAAYGSPDAASTGLLAGVLRRDGPGLQEDLASLGTRRSADFGKERLSNVADTWQGSELDPRKFLGSKRHGEWTEQGGGGGPPAGPRWGVTSTPPGLGAEDPRMQAIIKKQQAR